MREPNKFDDAYLLIKLDVGGLELCLQISLRRGRTEVIGVLNLRQGHAGCRFLRTVGSSSCVRHSAHRSRLILDISNFVKVHVGNLFVLNDGRVVRGRVPRQLREVL